MSGEDGTGGQPAPDAARAEIGTLWADTAFQKSLAEKDPAATRRWDGLYAAAYPDDAGGVLIDRGGGGDVPSSPEAYGVLPELEGAAEPAQLTAFREVAHQAGMTRGDFAELGARYYALASKAEAPPTPEQFDQAMARWHGPDAPKILAAAQAAAKRAIAANPALAEVLAVISNDASAVTLIGLHELRRAGKG